MYDYIIGKIIKEENYFILESNSIGYKVLCSSKTLEKLDTDKEIKIFTKLIVKEENILLYGFYNKEERSMFDIFIATSGIGPKIALDLLSTFNLSNLQQIILEQNAEMLTKTPGLGLKKSQKLIIEAKDKIKKLSISSSDMSDVKQDIISGLLSLGYSKKEIIEKIKSKEYSSIQEGIEDFLRNL